MIERTYFQPEDLKQARSILAKHPDAAIVAGGTDLVVAARSGKSPLPASLIAIHSLRELSGIEANRAGVKIGALTTHGDLEASDTIRRFWAALSDAAALVGSPATRHLGSIGGNICNASPAMELGSPLLIFDATVELASSGRPRRVPFSSFVVGPGLNDARPGELLTSVRLPALKVRGRAGSAYLRLEYRQSMEIAIVGAAAMIAVDKRGRCTDARVALTAVAPTCVRAPGTEEMLRGKAIESEVIERAAQAASDSARPIDDVRATADYRRAMVSVIVRRALVKALERATARHDS
ncbi:MAG TPA: xanthine dehydrogenase family protein subunit M [Candidatus Dormibacteraeota bacterium]|nr:xanthine dehydrogenase family protein subunit M [Candidatus Dormibacteraeota bacterium]